MALKWTYQHGLVLLLILLMRIPFCSAQGKDSTFYAKRGAVGVRMISVEGKYKVWTQKVGSGRIKVLLLHGGPANTHEYLEPFAHELHQDGIELYFYDQLGSYFSDQPQDPTIWRLDRFVEEVEQVRKGLQLDSLYILGHSWGAMLGLEYAAKYGQHVKGLIVSNMSYSTLNSYAQRIKLHQAIARQVPNGSKVLDEWYRGLPISDSSALQVIRNKFEATHVIRKSPLPEPLKRTLAHTNRADSKHMQPSVWYFTSQLPRIVVPTLLLGAKYDFIPVGDYQKMHKLIPGSQVYICPQGSHMAMWDDASHYFESVRNFLQSVEHTGSLGAQH